MPPIIIRLLISFICCCLPALASAATTSSVRAEWSKYTAPSGYTVSGYRLYQEGKLACLNTNATATAMDCQVTMSTSTANFTLTTAFTNGTESPHSSPFAFSVPAISQPSSGTTQPSSQTTGLNIEAGEISVSSTWVRVSFKSAFTNPIVVAGPPSFTNSDPCVVRIRNVSQSGFDIKLTEWNYQDGTHPAENVSYLVLEKGTSTLPDGSIVEAGSFTGTTSFNTVKFNGAFAKTPVVLTTVASFNESDTISGRIKNIGLTSFAYYFREQEKNANVHANETINYIAWEPGKGTIGSLQFEAATTSQSVTHNWYTRTFQSAFKETPVVLADMQTTNSIDTSAQRMQKVTATNFQVKVEEEKSNDTEVWHAAESVGYLALNSESIDSHSNTTAIAVNFQPAGVPIPNGFVVDSGTTFSATTGYGWSTLPNSLGTRDRNSSLSPDQSYDTMIHIAPTGVWEMTLPNGTYNVTVCIGDPLAPDTSNTVQAENVVLINNESLSSSKRWIERTGQVSVADGRLTLKFPGSSPYAKLCWVKIVSQ